MKTTIVLALFLFAIQVFAAEAETIAGWVSDASCGLEHTKAGGKDCVKKCWKGGADVGHPEWTAQSPVFINEKDQKIWKVSNPLLVKGYEGERIRIEAALDSKKEELNVKRILPYGDTGGAKRFVFHNNFWVNLHFYLRGTARRNLHPEEKKGLAPARSLSEEEKKSWEAALAYYEKEFAEKDLLFDEEMVRIKNEIVAAGNSENLENTKLDPALKNILLSAAPVYRKYWWPDHEQKNREWIATAQRLLNEFGEPIAIKVTAVYGEQWPETPFPVDVTTEAGWPGAYTTDHPLHTTIASADSKLQDYAALETLFHEVSHSWDARLTADLEAAAKASGKQAPDKLWHAVIFFTAGEVTRRQLDAVGIPYTPYAYLTGVYDRGMQPFRDALEKTWPARIDGKTSYSDALRELVAALQ